MTRSFLPKLTSTAGMLSTPVFAAALAAAACNQQTPPAETIAVQQSASTLAAQTPLDGATVPKYVEALPSLAATRVNGAAAGILLCIPTRSVQQRHLSVGLQDQRWHAPLAGADHRGAAEHRHLGDLHQQPARALAAAEVPHHGPDAALGRPAAYHQHQPLR